MRSFSTIAVAVPLLLVALTACTVSPSADAPSASAPASSLPSATPTPSPSLAAAELSPAPPATPSLSPDPTTAEPGTAQAAALALAVKGRSAKTGYERDAFGNAWVDVDRNGCDTRNDMLSLRLENRDMSGTCKVMSGDLNDPYTDSWISFVRGGSSEVDIDHIVALSDAWQKGASSWEFAKRVAFANDPLNLEPVDASANRQKGDGDAATWLPAHLGFRCEYVARQVAVKTKYELWVTQPEVDAILRVLSDCPDEPLPAAGSQPVIADNVGQAPESESEPDSKPEPKAKTSKDAPAEALDPQFPFCKDLPSGYGPYVEGEDPEYHWYADRDGDGMVCE